MLFTRLPTSRPDTYGITTDDLITILENNLFQKDDEDVKDVLEAIVIEDLYFHLEPKEKKRVIELLNQYQISM